MKYVKSFLVLAIAVLCFSSLSVQAQSYGNVNYNVPSTAIEKKVFKEIKKLMYYGVFDHIAFKVDGETVTLYGKVVRGITRKQAESFVKDIAGVRNVVNNIEVLPPSGFDSSIRYRTLQEFRAKGLDRYLWEPNPSVRIIVDGGHTTLEGYVATRGDYNLMNILANGVSGVFSVQNNLVIEKELNR
jgi:hyperosmotically inducible periplasmic protein